MPLIAAIAGVIAIMGSFLTPVTAFNTDEVAYIEMARAMAERGSLFVDHQAAPADAPALTRTYWVATAHGDRVVPQYPSGYALVAAPFYKLFGLKGLVLMNAIAGFLALWLTWKIALRMTADETIAATALLIAAFASYISSYMFAIWPHALALGVVLAGVLLVLDAAEKQGRDRYWRASAAGLFFGLGMFFRMDAVLLAAAVFFWLRLFALPKDRLIAIVFLVSLIPALWLSAWINEIKYDIFQPFTYGPKEDSNDNFYNYVLFGAVGIGGLIFSFVIDTSQAWVRRAVDAVRQPKVLGLCAIAIGAIALFVDPLFSLLRGVYVLTFDIQALAKENFVEGLYRNHYGQIDYWGLPKKAFFQNLPFAALALAPIMMFFRGVNVKTTGFCLLIIGAPLAFYSIRSFQGGMTFNMRYFLPMIPFVAILSAVALGEIQRKANLSPKTFRYSLFAGAFAGVLFYSTLSTLHAPWAIPLSLYPQLAVFLALGAVVIYEFFADTPGVNKTALILSGIAFGYASILSLNDAAGNTNIRVRTVEFEQAHPGLFKPGSLVLSSREHALVGASLNGVHVSRAETGEEDITAQAIAAYINDGRCVYIHTKLGLDQSGLSDVVDISPPRAQNATAEDNAIYTLPGLAEKCGFG